MTEYLKDRVILEAEYLINTKKTIRELASFFKISKSTIHKDMQERLKLISPKLDKKVQKILKEHLMNRHLKGGERTKEKYSKRVK